MNRKAQVAVEFFTTYGWVLVGIFLLFAVLFYYGAFDPMRFVPNQCSSDPNIPCQTYRFQGASSPTSPMRLLFQLTNNMDYDLGLKTNAVSIAVENIGKIGKATYLGNCTPQLPTIIKKGNIITCIVYIYDKSSIPANGKKLKFSYALNYTNCLTDPGYLINGSCSSGSIYTIEGVILTPMESSYVSTAYAFCGDGHCDAPGETPINCPADCPMPARVLISVSPNLVNPNGVDSAVITATVLNSSGSPMPSMPVTFLSTPIGVLANYVNTTINTGVATMTVTSNSSGNADVSASSYGVSNDTPLTFQAVPQFLQFEAYDVYAGVCAGSYLKTVVLDKNGKPIKDVVVNFSAGSNGNINPKVGVTDTSGMIVAYFSQNNPASVTIYSEVYMPKYSVDLKNQTTVTVVPCQQCNAPTTGDWIIDGNFDCENTTITLNGNINISLGIGYMQKFGNLTLKNVTLLLNGAYSGQRGIYMGRMASLRVYNSTIQPTGTSCSGQPCPYLFWAKSNASAIDIRNSSLTVAGNSTVSIGPYYLISDVTNGFYINSNNTLIDNDTFNPLPLYNTSGIILGNCSNSSITRSYFNNVYTAATLINSSNTLISSNTIAILYGTGLIISGSTYNNVTNNFMDGQSDYTTTQCPPTCPATHHVSGTGIHIMDNYSQSTASLGNNIINNTIQGFDTALYALQDPNLQVNIPTNVFNNTLLRFSSAALLLQSSKDFDIENNSLSSTQVTGPAITLEYSAAAITIKNNTIQTTALAGWGYNDPCGYSHADVCLNWYVTNTALINNTFFGCMGRIDASYSSNVSIINLNSYAGPPYQFYFYNTPGVLLNNSSINWTYLGNSGGSTIINNHMNNNGSNYSMINLTASDVNISNNVIGGTSCILSGAAIHAIYSNSSAVTISNNTIRGFKTYALYVNNSYASVSGLVEKNLVSAPCDGSTYAVSINNVTPQFIIQNNNLSTGINFTNSDPVVTTNNITTVNCISSNPLFMGNNITGSVDNCMTDNCPLNSTKQPTTPPITNGAWTITTTITCENRTINLTGNLNITGGKLILRNSTININIPSSDFQYGINVKNGGKLVAQDLDNNPATWSDSSAIKSANSFRYSLFVDNSSSFIMANSKMTGGGRIGNLPAILILSNAAQIYGSNLSGNHDAIMLVNSSNHIIKNNIFNDDNDTFLTLDNSNNSVISGNVVLKITNNTIVLYNGSTNNSIFNNYFWNEMYSSIRIVGPSGKNSIYSNNFSSALGSLGRGISIESSPNNTIYLNNFTYSYIPLYIISSSNNNFSNNFLNESAVSNAGGIIVNNSISTNIYSNNFSYVYGGIQLYNSSNSSIYNNIFNNPYNAADTSVYSDISATNNPTSQTSSSSGVPLNYTYIINNTMTGFVLNTAIYDYNSSSYITGNNISTTGAEGQTITASGIFVGLGTYEGAFNNTINGFLYGMYALNNGQSYYFQMNNVTNCTLAGIYLNTPNMEVANNTIMNCNGPSCSGVYYYNNSFPSGYYTVVANNNLTNNYYGVSCVGGSLYMIANTYFNNIVNCTTACGPC